MFNCGWLRLLLSSRPFNKEGHLLLRKEWHFTSIGVEYVGMKIQCRNAWIAGAKLQQYFFLQQWMSRIEPRTSRRFWWIITIAFQRRRRTERRIAGTFHLLSVRDTQGFETGGIYGINRWNSWWKSSDAWQLAYEKGLKHTLTSNCCSGEPRATINSCRTVQYHA